MKPERSTKTPSAIAERTAAAEEFAYHAIGDIEAALKKIPGLPEGRAVLDWVRQWLERLRELHRQSK
jgi:CHASE3 domain sensor protein